MRKIGNRFHIKDDEIVKNSNGEVLPPDEPLFLMRARDWLAVDALKDYRARAMGDGCNDYLLSLLDETIAEFETFKRDHPKRMKQPGITRGK